MSSTRSALFLINFAWPLLIVVMAYLQLCLNLWLFHVAQWGFSKLSMMCLTNYLDNYFDTFSRCCYATAAMDSVAIRLNSKYKTFIKRSNTSVAVDFGLMSTLISTSLTILSFSTSGTSFTGTDMFWERN